MDSQKVKFSLLQITYWCSSGAFISYAASYFLNVRGLSTAFVGTTLSLYTVTAFFGQFFWGYLCDRLKNRTVVILSSMLSVGLYIVVFFMKNSWWILTTYAILGFVMPCIVASIDTWILKVYSDNPSAYGPIRAFGSLGYAVFMFFYGSWLLQTGYVLMLWLGIFFLICVVVLCFLLPNGEGNVSSHQKTSGKIQLNRNWILFFIFLFLSGTAAAPMLNMIAVLIESVNGTVVQQSYCLFLNSLAQVPLMLLAGKFSRISPMVRMEAGVACYSIALFMAAIATNTDMMIGAALTQGIGFGIILPAMREYVFQGAPKGKETVMQGIADAVNTNLAGALSNLMVGWLAELITVSGTMYLCVVLQVLGLLIGTYLVFARHREKSIVTDKQGK